MKSNSLLKIGRPSKYSPSMPKNVINYINFCLKSDKFPTIEGLAIKLGVGTRTLYDWEGEYMDFSQTMEAVRTTQRSLLIQNGLTGKYSTSFAAFLLKALHGFSDGKVVEATQNNYMNVSPELMADALRLMKEKDKLSN